ncbi:unnamed protein product, partial [Mesorhabditis belari]|uniref:ShKT domain-containing protein n=1 Tax=Mesorhabditis belari TaxID=2138241 RepID=A0AAF3FDR0_9BILA
MIRYICLLVIASKFALGTQTCTDAGNGPCISGSCNGGETCVTFTGTQVCCPANKLVNSGVSTRSTCMDKVNPRTGTSDCTRLAYLCNDSTYYQVMTDQCPKTCGRCGSYGYTAVTSSGSCVDKTNPSTGMSDCPNLMMYCTNSRYMSLMRQQCPKTCGFC